MCKAVALGAYFALWFAFFAGGGAVKFVKDYAAAGLNKSIPLYGAGFLTDGTLEAQGADADGLLTTLHYGDGEFVVLKPGRHVVCAVSGLKCGPRPPRSSAPPPI